MPGGGLSPCPSPLEEQGINPAGGGLSPAGHPGSVWALLVSDLQDAEVKSVHRTTLISTEQIINYNMEYFVYHSGQ